MQMQKFLTPSTKFERSTIFQSQTINLLILFHRDWVYNVQLIRFTSVLVITNLQKKIIIFFLVYIMHFCWTYKHKSALVKLFRYFTVCLFQYENFFLPSTVYTRSMSVNSRKPYQLNHFNQNYLIPQTVGVYNVFKIMFQTQ